MTRSTCLAPGAQTAKRCMPRPFHSGSPVARAGARCHDRPMAHEAVVDPRSKDVKRLNRLSRKLDQARERLADDLTDPDVLVRELLAVGEGFQLSERRPSLHPGVRRQEAGRQGGARSRCGAAVGPAGAAVRREQGWRQALAAARRPGHGHLRQGRHHAARRRRGRPAGCAAHRLQEADGRGARQGLPVADPPGAAAGGGDRCLRPVALRGRARGARARPRAEGDVVEALRAPSTTSSAGSSSGARPSSRSCCTSAATSRRTVSPSGSSAPTSTGSTTPATSTSARSGTTTSRPTRSRSTRCSTRGRAVVRRAGRPQVVRALGGAAAAPRAPRGHGAAVAAGRLRRRRRAGPPRLLLTPPSGSRTCDAVRNPSRPRRVRKARHKSPAEGAAGVGEPARSRLLRGSTPVARAISDSTRSRAG